MRSRLVQLLTARRFAPLFVTQFLGAFNDNLLKASLGIFVTYRLAADAGLDPASLVMLAGAIFIAPFFLFSGAAGTLADRLDKATIARRVKIAEIAIMAVGAFGLQLQSIALLLTALFGLGTHSSIFGPIKYALLPQHLSDDELVAGNALIARNWRAPPGWRVCRRSSCRERSCMSRVFRFLEQERSTT